MRILKIETCHNCPHCSERINKLDRCEHPDLEGSGKVISNTRGTIPDFCLLEKYYD